MLNRGVHSVFIPVENFVGDVIVNASEITLSKCICIYQYRSTANPDLTFAALEEIVEFNIPGRKTDFTKDAEIVCQSSALNEGKPHAFGNSRNRYTHRLLQGFGAELSQKGLRFLFQFFLFDVRDNVG